MSTSGLKAPNTHEADLRPLYEAMIKARDAFMNFRRPPEGADMETRIAAEAECDALQRAYMTASDAVGQASRKAAT